MKRDPSILIADMLFSMDRIEKSVKGISFEEFKDDISIQDAVVRRFSIIGEAANNLSKEFKEQHKEINWHDIIGMRNLLIHEYFDIDLKVVWDTAKKDLPHLKSKLKITIKGK